MTAFLVAVVAVALGVVLLRLLFTPDAPVVASSVAWDERFGPDRAGGQR